MTLTQIKPAGLSTPVDLADNAKIRLGASNDLQIYHDGNHSRIDEVGSGSLLLQTNGASIQLNKGTSENMLVAYPDGAVKLYYDGGTDPKFETHPTGTIVTGQQRFTNTGVASSYIGANSDGGVFGTDTAGLVFKTGVTGGDVTSTGTPRITIDSSGNVGIGTSTPLTDAQLTISATDTPGLAFQRSGSGKFDTAIQISSGHFHFKAGADSSTIAGLSDVMKIESTGRVGIGATTVDRHCHIEGTDNVLLKLQNNQTVCLMEFQDTDTTAGNRPTIGADGNDAVFYTGGSQNMVLDSSGRVGIGTTSPSRKLVVAGDTNTVVSVNGATNGTSSLFLGDTDDEDVGSISYNHSTEDLTFTAGASQRLSIKSSGAAFGVPIQLGSSNSHDSAKIVLQGSGNTSSTNSVYIKNSDETPLFVLRNDGVFFTGTDGNSPYNSTTGSAANVHVSSNGALSRSTSSVRYKKDIADATFGLADVLKLKPKTFKSNATGEFADDKTYAGFTAEDIHDLGLTEFVQYNENNEPDALAYGNMVALMAKAIQELNAKVAALEAA